MPIFMTDKISGLMLPWTTKAQLRAKTEEMAANFVAERHETFRLRAKLTSDNAAWDDLLAAYDDLAKDLEILGAKFDESDRVREILAERITTLRDEATAAIALIPELNTAVDDLCAQRDEAQRLVGILRAQIDCLDDGSYEEVQDTVRDLLRACTDADAKNMATCGRAGRLGTKRIRRILGRSS